jgi:peptidoglycan/xylan/chitin deacetylase (PgdA/CDA1 family)
MMCAALAVAACVHQGDDDETTGAIESTVVSSLGTSAVQTDTAPREQRDGRAFPDGVIALTWDDGPDAHTLALAEYLEHERISATFFVVGDWTKASSDPGFGARVHDTGHAHVPILGKLVAMGHRIANHTMHHTLLGHASAKLIAAELGEAQRAIDPFIRDEMRAFRVPGGDWSAAASRSVDGDESLAALVGPIRWDVDAKDWAGSSWCDGAHPSRDCEHANGRLRVRPEIMAQRYESAIESTRHGIVLLHDRVADVGSQYALDVAHALVPQLVARGYVFAAPVLAFSPMRTRWNVATCAGLRVADLDGDGRGDACVQDHDRITCATSIETTDDHGLNRVAFDPKYDELLLPARAEPFELVDVTGDGKADVCVRADGRIECAPSGRALEPWTRERWDGELRFADIDGDGKVDVCAFDAHGVRCARSTGAAFETARAWSVGVRGASRMALGDVNGDGHADLCMASATGVECALAGHGSFGAFVRFTGEVVAGAMTLADVNGDGRADLCQQTKDTVACALSNGHALLKSTVWLDSLDSAGSLRAEWPGLGDINGDGRSDFCDCDGNGVRCALAP